MERKKKIYEKQEAARLEKEKKWKEKIEKINERVQNKEKSTMSIIEQKKYRENEKFEIIKRNHESLKEIHEQKSQKILEASKLPIVTRRQSDITKLSSSEKLKTVQDEAKKRLEEKREMLNKKMAAFDERMKKKQEYEKMSQEERRELARQWAETLKINLSKKKNKDEYRRETLEEKLKRQQEKQKSYDEHQKIMAKERFYAKISNEMKTHYVKEALHEMSLKKNWSLERIEEIMDIFQPEIQDGVHKDRKKIDNGIKHVLKDPFHETSSVIGSKMFGKCSVSQSNSPINLNKSH